MREFTDRFNNIRKGTLNDRINAKGGWSQTYREKGLNDQGSVFDLLYIDKENNNHKNNSLKGYRDYFTDVPRYYQGWKKKYQITTEKNKVARQKDK